MSPKYLLPLLLAAIPFFANASDRPNILWISSEDHGPHLGSYGDEYATTPNLDRFSESSLRYTRASSTAPVCSPARTTIISGMYAPSTGSHHMRCRVPSPESLKFFTRYLQEAGYYTTNNVKEDYNLTTDNKGWDESSKQAHWKNAPDGKPFFAVFNFFRTHESQIRNENENPIHDPALAPIPPYHPDTPEVRKDWAQYYDRLTLLDQFFQDRLDELEEAGLADDTIVIFFADHGSGMPRSKRYPGWSGLHVPMIIHVPEKFKHLAPKEYGAGATSNRLVGFIDLAPTTLSIAGIPIPDYHQGHAFMGESETPTPDYSFGFRGRMDERPDFCRSVTDGRYMYIRNYMSHLPHGQFLAYQQQTNTTAQWYRQFNDGVLNETQSTFWQPHPHEELFDLAADPHETNNLASLADHQQIRNRLSSELDDHMLETRDLGFYPEPMLRQIITEGKSPLDVLASKFENGANPIFQTLEAPSKNLKEWKATSPEKRYWTLINLLEAKGSAVQKATRLLTHALGDSEPIVAIAAAECLVIYSNSDKLRNRALDTLMKYAAYPENEVILSVHALNGLDHAREQGIELPEGAKNLAASHPSIPRWADSYRKAVIDRF